MYKRQVLLTAAMSMGEEGGALEEACLYFETDAETMMYGYDVQNPATRMFLILDGQVLAGDEQYQEEALRFLANPNAEGGDMDWCITTPVANTGLCVLTLVDNHQPVSYTHLDVYKRQILCRKTPFCCSTTWICIISARASRMEKTAVT